MILGRRMIPVLVALLVLQGGLAVLPHQHGHAATNGPGLAADSSHETAHDCLACSIHALVMEGSEGPSPGAGLTEVSGASEPGVSILGLTFLGNACPRGPPSFV